MTTKNPRIEYYVLPVGHKKKYHYFPRVKDLHTHRITYSYCQSICLSDDDYESLPKKTIVEIYLLYEEKMCKKCMKYLTEYGFYEDTRETLV